jgi:hypothetical protein
VTWQEAVYGSCGFILGVLAGWGTSRDLLPTRATEGVATVRNRIMESVRRHTVGIVLFTVIICSGLVIATGFLYAHKDDYQHCVNGWLSQLGVAQAPRAKASVALQRAQQEWVKDSTEANKRAYLEAYENYNRKVKANPLPPEPACFKQ